MKHRKFRSLLAAVCACLTLAQGVQFSTLTAFAVDAVAAQADAAAYELKDGTAIIKSGMSEDEVNAALTAALTNSTADLEWEYYCTGKTRLGTWGNASWGSIAGFKSETGKYVTITYTHPALAENADGSYRVRVAGTETAVTLTKKAALDSSITLNEGVSIALPYNEDVTVNFDALRQSIFDQLVAETTPALTVDDVTIEYYATAKTGVVTAWMPLEGGSKNLLTYPAISEGVHKIRISFAGNEDYIGTSVEGTITIAARPSVTFQQKDGPYTVALTFASDDLDYDYAAAEQAIWDAVVASTEPKLTLDDVTITYDASLTGIIKNYQPLNNTASGTKKFGAGEQSIRISFAGDTVYAPTSLDVTVTVTKPERIETTVVLKDGAAITYNKDAEAMKAAMFEQLIDWEASELPEGVAADRFTFEYYAKPDTDNLGELSNLIDLVGGLDQLLEAGTTWAPIEGGKVGITILGRTVGLNYAPMGAGEQQVRITYKGSKDYAPSEAEGALTVNKAKVTVKVNSTTKFADETLPDSFVTTSVDDNFDLYIVYAGITSNVTTALYLELPERYTDSSLLKLLDPIAEQIIGKSFTQMLNDGITLGELRTLFDSTELLELLDKLQIDTGALGTVLNVINQMPSVLDSVRVSFGEPNRAGAYTVAAVTENPNYETAFGMGALLVKMRTSGVSLNWNQTISGGKLTAEQAKTFDFGATLTCDGQPANGNVRYLYSGVTSKWRVYSSTTTPPTEPGRYVQTVVTLGGNYQAAPVTRSFQITK